MNARDRIDDAPPRIIQDAASVEPGLLPKGKTLVPEELRFAVTRKCTGACRHCYNNSGQTIRELSANEFVAILRDMKERNPRLDRITLTGGEPLDEKEKVLSIAAAARSLGIRVRLVTRGWELTPRLCVELREAGVTRIQVGLDSSGRMDYYDTDGNTWDTFHSWLRADPEGFVKAVGGIRNAVAADLRVSVRYSLSRANGEDAVGTYAFVSGLGASKFKLRVLFPGGRATRGLYAQLVTGEELARTQFALTQASRDVHMQVEMTQPCFFPLPSRHRLEQGGFDHTAYKEACPCGSAAAYIDTNGDVKYCLFDEHALGNVFADHFLHVWNSEAARKARAWRCPIDRSGTACSAFALQYSQCGDYSHFIKEYVLTATKLTEQRDIAKESVRVRMANSQLQERQESPE